ncbi:MAG: hypothetical protein ACXVB0_14110 [Mucilaginibacter sp.]
MKFSIILAVFILSGLRAWSQTYNTISFVYGAAETITPTTGMVEYQPYTYYTYTVKSGPRFGLMYEHRFNRSFAIVGDVLFTAQRAQYYYIYGADQPVIRNRVNMISVQALCKYSFLKYLFVDAGLSIDNQTKLTVYDQMRDQTGPGFEAGLGATVTAGHITFAVNPFWRDHFIVTLYHSNSNNRLTEDGIKFSVGYSF